MQRSAARRHRSSLLVPDRTLLGLLLPVRCWRAHPALTGAASAALSRCCVKITAPAARSRLAGALRVVRDTAGTAREPDNTTEQAMPTTANMADAAVTPQRRTRAPRAAAAAAAVLPGTPVQGGADASLDAAAPFAASLIMRTNAALQEATDAIAAIEPKLLPLIQQHGLPERLLAKEGSYFVALAKSICFQQLAISAAAAIFKRFLATCGAETKEELTPAKVLAVDLAQLRACGLSERKASYLQDLARHFQEGQLSDELLAGANDAELVEALTRVKGIGAWTAHMFEMFSLGKSDILPVGDLGVRKGIQALFGLKALPSPEEMAKLTEPWRPYRSVGCYYMWQMPSTPASPAKRKKAAAATVQAAPAIAAASAAETAAAATAAADLVANVQEPVTPLTPPQKRQRRPSVRSQQAS